MNKKFKKVMNICCTIGIFMIVIFAFTKTFKSSAASSDFIIENGVLIKYKGKAKEVIIPKSVKEIGKEVFKYNSEITSVVIPDTVMKIGYFAFSCTILGCDEKSGEGAAQWAEKKLNILNVAMTRVKHRVAIIGHGDLWRNVPNFDFAYKTLYQT